MSVSPIDFNRRYTSATEQRIGALSANNGVIRASTWLRASEN